jgi:hypothetical protein
LNDQVERSVALRAENQAVLVRFLSIDIDLAFIFLQSARTTSDLNHARALLAKARLAIESIRHWAGRVEDPRELRAIHLGVDKLEDALILFSIELPSVHNGWTSGNCPLSNGM